MVSTTFTFASRIAMLLYTTFPLSNKNTLYIAYHSMKRVGERGKEKKEKVQWRGKKKDASKNMQLEEN